MSFVSFVSSLCIYIHWHDNIIIFYCIRTIKFNHIHKFHFVVETNEEDDDENDDDQFLKRGKIRKKFKK